MKAICILLYIYSTGLGLHLLNVESTSLNHVPSFSALPLCDSAILITWEMKDNVSDPQTRYSFTYQEIHGVQLGPELRAWRTANIDEGQIKLNNFKENTKYRISIYEERKEQSPIKYFLDSKTREIDFLECAKPEFDYKIFKERYWNSNIKIKWYPCGKQHECYDNAPGCSFYVKFRIKGAEEFQKIIEYYEDYVYVRDCLPGKVYEFIVSSNNLPSETESDTKEIIVPPEASPVNNFEALPLGSFSILLTWEPPHQINGNLTGYKIFYEDKVAPYKFIYPDRYDSIAPNHTRIILSHLLPNTAYRIHIAARTDIGLGAINSIDVHTSKNEIPTPTPFKPQASLSIIDVHLDLPKLRIVWLPCGSEKNCHGQNAGSYFKVKYKFENESTFCELSQYDQDFLVIENLLPNITYDLIVVSVDQTKQTESNVYKIIIPNSGHRVYESVQGNDVTLPCTSNSSAELKVEPKWLKNDFELTTGKYIQQSNADLLITNVSVIDSGKYACTVHSSPLKIDDLVFLSVKKKTEVKLLAQKSKHQELHTGEKFSLRCQADTDPSLSIYSYRWFKNGNPIDFGTNFTLVKPEVNVLQFLNISSIDTANYTCIANTRLDNSSDTMEVTVSLFHSI